MTSPLASTEDERLILGAYVDGELDASTALRIERRIESDPAFKAEFERLTALRSALRSGVPRETTSAELRARIAAITTQRPPARVPRTPVLRSRSFEWRQMAASVIVAASLASAGTAVFLRGDGSNPNEANNIVAEHRRTLLSANPIDVESSDRHTVKPWFDNKLALSPQVIDLVADGFPLAGGRVDVVGGKLVPAMLYHRHAHLISLVAVPRQGGRDDGAAPSSATQDGYEVAGWHGQDFDYYAVSDVAKDDLAAFVTAWRVAAKQ